MKYQPVDIGCSMRYGNNRWRAYSPKIDRIVNLNSSLEYDYWILVETDFNIISFCEQPLKIESIHEGKLRHSIFDMWLQEKDGLESFVEVKYSNELEPSSKGYERNKRQHSIQKEWCKNHNFNHILITDKEIRSNTILLDNKKLMLPFFRQFKSIPQDARLRVMNSIFNGSNSIIQVKKSLTEIHPQLIQTIIFELIYKEIVTSNISTIPIGKETRFIING